MPDDWEEQKQRAQSPFHGELPQWKPIKGAAQHVHDDIQKMAMRAQLEANTGRVHGR